MRRVTITQFHYEPDLKTFVGQVVSVIEVDDGGASAVRGSDAFLNIPAAIPSTGETVSAHEDPLRWSDLIAETIAYGDIDVEVQEVAERGAASSPVEPDSVATQALAALVHEH
jgi:hypothetical protein